MKNYPSIDYRSYSRSQEGGIPFRPSGDGVHDPEKVISPLEEGWGMAEFDGKKPPLWSIPFELEMVLLVALEIGVLVGVVGLLIWVA